ncbi:MAG TPA: SDR family oxidoreductase [Panacibacter sp.]|nr:SDR family oxidoreductase [Panacibacter sp.]
MDKVIVITGGSRGIGKATAIKAAEKGYAVCVNYKSNKEAADEVVNTINNSGGKAIAVQADIAVEEEVIKLFKTVDDSLGTITALVNNAGILETQSLVVNMSAERFERVFRTNVIGTFLCAKEAVKRMSLQNGGKGGAIVNVSSKASTHGGPFEYVDYASSKGAVDTFTMGLSKEVAADGIRVNAVRPGVIYTDIHASGGEAGRVDRIAPTVPMKRGGQPEEVADTILWLLSDEASYVTGVLVDVTGGR